MPEPAHHIDASEPVRITREMETPINASRAGAPPQPVFLGYRPDAWRYLAYSFGSGLSEGFLQVLLGLYILSIGYQESFVATQGVVVALGSAAFSLLAGVVVDRLGTKVSLLLAAGLNILGRFLLVAEPSQPAILGASFVLSAGVAFYWVSQGAVLAQVSTPDQRARLFGLNWAVLVAASFVGGLLAGWLPGVIGGVVAINAESSAAYRYSFWIGVIALLLGALPLLRLGTGKLERVAHATSSWWRVSEARTVARLIIPIAASALAIGFTAPFMSIFLQGTYDASTRSIGIALGVFSLAGAVGGLLSPRLAARFGAVRTVSGLLVLSAPLMLLTGYAPALGVASVALWGRGLLANAAWPIALGYLIESTGERERGRVSALMNISFELSLAAAALPAGLLMERVDYRLPYLLAASALLLGGLGFAYASRRTAITRPATA